MLRALVPRCLRLGENASMTRHELLDAVPLRDNNGRPYYVNLDDIPQPWRDQFWAALDGAQIPVIDGVERAAYIQDWQQWVRGTGKWKSGPKGITVAELIATLQTLPPDLAVMLTFSEGGIDCVRSVKVIEVARHSRDWSTSPIGQYRETPNDETIGEAFRVVLIDLES